MVLLLFIVGLVLFLLGVYLPMQLLFVVGLVTGGIGLALLVAAALGVRLP